MQMSATVKSIRITPRKMGLLADEIRGQGINQALSYLKLSPRKRTADVLSRLLKSAVANANHRGTVDVDQLFVKTLLVGKGATMKRFRPRAKGAAFRILKYTCQVSVTLAEK